MGDMAPGQEIRRRYFTGRNRKKRTFRRVVSSLDPFCRTMVIYGPGGRGKSWLLEAFGDICSELGVPVGWYSVRESTYSVDAMMELRAQIDPRKGWRASYHRFDDIIDKWWAIQAKLAKPQITERSGQRLTGQVALTGAKETANATIAAVITAATGSVAFPLGVALGTTTSLLLDGIQGSVQALLARGLTLSEARLILSAEDVLTQEFVATINHLADRQRVVLMFDSFEKRSVEFEAWIRLKLLRQLRADHVLVVIAARDKLDEAYWADTSRLLDQAELGPFTLSETRRYLRRRGVSNTKQQERVFARTKGLPLGVALSVAAHGVDAVGRARKAELKISVIADVVTNLLRDVSPHLRDLIRGCSVPRELDARVLSELFDGASKAELLDQLENHSSLFRDAGEGLAQHDDARVELPLHDDVRAFLLASLKRDTVRFEELHRKMAAYYRNELERIETTEGMFNGAWERSALEELYHEFAIGLGRGMAALDRKMELARSSCRLLLARSLVSEVQAFASDLDLPKSVESWLEYYRTLLAYDSGDWRIAIEQLAQLSDTIGNEDSHLRARVLLLLGIIHYYQGGLREAEVCYTRSRDLMTRLRDEVELARAAATLGGHIYRVRGDLDRSLRLYTEGFELFKRRSDLYRAGTTMLDVGNVYRLQGKYPEALRACQESQDIFEQLGNHNQVGRAMYTLGRVLMEQGQLDQALEQHLRALELLQGIDAPYGIAMALRNIADVHQAKGEIPLALAEYDAALTIFDRLGTDIEIARVLGDLGTLHASTGNLERAEHYYTQCMEMKRKLGDEYGLGVTSHQIARLRMRQGRYPEARENLNFTLGVMRKHGNSQRQIDTILGLCKLNRQEGRPVNVGLLQTGVDLCLERGFPGKLAQLLFEKAISHFSSSQFMESCQFLGDAFLQAASSDPKSLHLLMKELTEWARGVDSGENTLAMGLCRYLSSVLRDEPLAANARGSLADLEAELSMRVMATVGNGLKCSLTGVDTAIAKAIAAGVFPGGTMWIGWCGKIVVSRSFGHTAGEEYPGYVPAPVASDTIYDLASLTKVVATTPAVLQLAERAEVDLADPVAKYIPEFGVDERKAPITIWQLLTHTSGLPVHVRLFKWCKDRNEVITAICNQSLDFPPGTQRKYSDIGFILLGEIVRRVSGARLDEYVKANVFKPLGMTDTMFNPPKDVRSRVAPTEYVDWRGGLVHGEAHDENAWVMGGVAGHAGLFSTAEDLGRFCDMILRFGELDGRRVLRPTSVATMSRVQYPDTEQAAGLGWALNARSFMGGLASSETIGHTGFTGTSIVMSPKHSLAVVLLTNRVCPTRDGPDMNPCRREIGDALSALV